MGKSQAAVRELKEETGYTGRVLRTSGPLTMSPGLSDETVKLVVVEVDLDIPESWPQREVGWLLGQDQNKGVNLFQLVSPNVKEVRGSWRVK